MTTELEIKLSNEFLARIKSALKHFDPNANESTRTHKLVALLLNEVEFLSNQKCTYIAEPTNNEGQRPDFLVSHEGKAFFIIEAKAGISQTKALEQIHGYLLTHKLINGCLTDGIQWAMYEMKSDKKLVLVTSFLINEAQEIVDWIVSKI